MSDVIEVQKVTLSLKDAEKCPKDGFPFTVKMRLICKDFEGDVFYCPFCHSPFYDAGKQYVEFVSGGYREVFINLIQKAVKSCEVKSA